MAGAGAIHIGCSGWSYSHWKGDFYPARLPSGQWLEHYAGRFPTVEVNNSFYRVPRPEIVAAWAARTPPGFLFSYKLWRGITHYARLKGKRRELRWAMGCLDACPPARRGALLVHLPPQMRKDDERFARLAEFLPDLRKAAGRRPWRTAVEFRHASWLDRETYRLLGDEGVAVCAHDARDGPTVEPNDAPFVYLRRHGPTMYSSAYTARSLRHDAQRIAGWTAEGRDVLAYLNNDLGGHAPRDAVRLRALVDAADVPRPRRRPQRPWAARKAAAGRAGSALATTGTSSGKRAR